MQRCNTAELAHANKLHWWRWRDDNDDDDDEDTLKAFAVLEASDIGHPSHPPTRQSNTTSQ